MPELKICYVYLKHTTFSPGCQAKCSRDAQDHELAGLALIIAALCLTRTSAYNTITVMIFDKNYLTAGQGILDFLWPFQ